MRTTQHSIRQSEREYACEVLLLFTGATKYRTVFCGAGMSMRVNTGMGAHGIVLCASGHTCCNNTIQVLHQREYKHEHEHPQVYKYECEHEGEFE
eukprot:14850594-Alexandrium_andersonii.AAC.1